METSKSYARRDGTPREYVYQLDEPVPFSPIPAHCVDTLKFRAEDTYTYTGTPMMKLADANYRLAVLFRSDEERSRDHGDLAMALEDAYMVRQRADYQAEQAAKAVSL